MKLGVATILLAANVACSSATPQNVERGVIGGTYESELIECVFQGRDAHSKAVYHACADAVDQRFGVRNLDAGAGLEGGK